MKFEVIKKLIRGIPFIAEDNAKQLYDFIIQNKITSCLELGFAHGAASCYIAAALDELGEGKLVSVDLIEAKDIFQPGITELLIKTGLGKYVEIYREATGYNWFLHNEIKKSSGNNQNICVPKFELCIIDGPKNWTIDSSAFFLVDKLLKEKGWIVFDDYLWTYKDSEKRQSITDGITHRHLSEQELNIPHVQEIFHLLVMQHPAYSNFKIHGEGDWAWAQKINNNTKHVKYVYKISFKDLLARVFYKLKRKLNN